MGWQSHPDTMTMVSARRVVDGKGIAAGTLEWRKAFRSAYAELAEQDSHGLDGLPYAKVTRDGHIPLSRVKTYPSE